MSHIQVTLERRQTYLGFNQWEKAEELFYEQPCRSVRWLETPPHERRPVPPIVLAAQARERNYRRMPTRGMRELVLSNGFCLQNCLFCASSYGVFEFFRCCLQDSLFNHCLGFSFDYVGFCCFQNFLVSLRTYLTTTIVRAVDFGSWISDLFFYVRAPNKCAR